LKDQIYLYDDPIKLFLEENLRRIPYFQQLQKDTFHDVMFNFRQDTTDKGTYIFKEGETSNGLFIVKSGIVEILVRVEGYELAIERLYRGSIINHNAFLIGDICDISARCIDT
jgi:CRP-like cAMP-binding protein